MGRATAPSEAEVRAAFDRAVRGALKRGDGPPTCHGLDDETSAAVDRLARAYPNAPDELVAAARAELEKQFDGTHAREWQAKYGA